MNSVMKHVSQRYIITIHKHMSHSISLVIKPLRMMWFLSKDYLNALLRKSSD